MSKEQLHEKLLAAIKDKFGDKVLTAIIDYGMPVVSIETSIYTDLCKWLKEDAEWEFNHFIDITAVDYVKPVEERFEIVVHLRSHKHNIKVRIKTRIGGEKPSIPTLHDIYIGSKWSEREVYDLFGIKFDGNPRMTRILNPDDFEGYPLRKDFPVKGTHRGSFPRGTIISNKRQESAITKETRPKPLDQLLPRTPQEQKREPISREAKDA